MAKIKIIIEDSGGEGHVKITTDPKMHVVQDMVRNGHAKSCHAYAGLMLKQFYAAVPSKTNIATPGDVSLFDDAKTIQRRKLTPHPRMSPSGIILPN